MIHPCGCQNEIDAESGVMHCVKKCDSHITWAITHSNDRLEHYKEMGCLVNGIPQNKKLIEELIQGFIDDLEFLRRGNGKRLLEIGCGLGAYVPFFLANGWSYIGVEQARVAAYWTINTFDVLVYDKPFEEFIRHPMQKYNTIFGAHVFEHLIDSPRCMQTSYDLLETNGKIFILVPDDTDQTNPDHWWFFTQDTLRALLEKIGFVNIRMTVRKIVEHENFIYCVAEKP